MADDFDDDLYNAYNEASEHKPMENIHDTFEDEFADALDTTKEDSQHQQQQQQDRFMAEDDDNNTNDRPPPPPQQQQQPQRQNYNNYTNQQRYYQQNSQNNQNQQQQTVMMGGVAMPYQMALAYQQQMQQMMAANPLQLQMMQQQYRQMQQQQQQQQQQHRRPYQQRPHQPEDKESLDRKMFVGGLDWNTTDDSLRDHFSKFGPVASCSVMRDMATGQSRGFAFLSMVNAADVDKVLEEQEHVVDGKKIDPKRAVSRSDQPPPQNSSSNSPQQQQQDDSSQSEKIFVGGISPNVDREEFKTFFEQFGNVVDATLMMDRQTGRPRGFGFITFETSQEVERALDANPADLVIKEKRVEIKRATPKTRQFNNPSHQQQRPNTRYAGAAHGFNRPNNMYPNQQQQQPYGAMAAATPAAYYGRMNQQDDNGGDDYDRRRGEHRSSRHRDGSRDDRYRSEERSGGGAVHASSSSRNQSSYRPY